MMVTCRLVDHEKEVSSDVDGQKALIVLREKLLVLLGLPWN